MIRFDIRWRRDAVRKKAPMNEETFGIEEVILYYKLCFPARGLGHRVYACNAELLHKIGERDSLFNRFREIKLRMHIPLRLRYESYSPS